MGWPRGNAWYYPTILNWDTDDDGYYSIPAYIYFFRNPEKQITDIDKRRFSAMLNRLLPGPYDVDWNVDPVYIVAIRRHIRQITFETEDKTEGRFNRYSTLEWGRWGKWPS
jgi:hypothetical protein